MKALRHILQLALAALIASAGGGLILLPLFGAAAAVTAFLEGAPAGMDSAAAAVPIVLLMLMLSGLAIVPAVSLCWLPAFLVGAFVQSAGRTKGWARRRPAWAAAGAAVAGIAWLRVLPPGAAHPNFGGSGLGMPAVLVAFLLAGAVAGLVYRSALSLIAPFLGLEEEEGEG